MGAAARRFAAPCEGSVLWLLLPCDVVLMVTSMFDPLSMFIISLFRVWCIVLVLKLNFVFAGL